MQKIPDTREEALNAANGADSNAKVIYGYMLLKGLKGEVDEAKAKNWFEEAAKVDNLFGQYFYATLLENSDPASAKDWYQKAMEQGSVEAKTSYAMLLKGEDLSRAKELLSEAAEAGDGLAQLEYAELLRNGLEADKAEARVWCKKAADQEYKEHSVISHLLENL